MDFKKLKNEIEEASQKCFLALRAKYPEENICSYALYSDAGAMSVSPAINSTEYLEEMCADDPEDSVYYKWSPGEWNHECEEAGFFEDISKYLQIESSMMTTQIQFSEFKENVYEACVESLESLVNNGFFAKDDSNCIIVFSISDAAEPKGEIKWIERLNGQEKASEFSGWVNSL